jgi:hypothetical protein
MIIMVQDGSYGGHIKIKVIYKDYNFIYQTTGLSAN